MKKTILKSLMIGAFAFSALTVPAANLQLVMDDITVEPGGYSTANVYLQHDNYFSAIELHFALIDGISFYADFPNDLDIPEDCTPWPMAGNPQLPPATWAPMKWTPSENTDVANNEYKIVCKYDANNVEGVVAYFPPGKTLICRLWVIADDSFTGAKLHLNYCKTDYSDPTQGAPAANTAELSNVDVCQIKVPTAGTPLAEIVSAGVDGTEYVVADPLYVVTKSDKAHCVFVTDGPEKGNWMKIYAEGEVYNAIADMEIIQKGTLKGKLSEASGNQQLTVTTAPTEGEPDESLIVEPKEWNLAQDVPGSDDWHFAPKVNEVIALTGYWQDNAFSGYLNNGGQVVTASMAWCDTETGMEPEMEPNGLYKNVVSAVQLKPTNGSKAESDLPYTKYIVYPTTIKTENVFTGVENLKGDKAVVSVQYVNVAGQVANTPFQGVNMVVTRYADGSTVTTKVIK